MALGRPLGAKLFLEGKEVPFIGATMTSAVGQAGIAYIDMVPHQSILHIKPRTRVEIFVRNYLQSEADSKAKTNPFPYVIAWKGEVFGYNFGKTSTSRTFSLSCIDHSSYWDNCLAYFFNHQQSQSAGADKASQVLEYADIKRTGEKIIPAYLSQASWFKTRIEEVLKKEPGSDFMDGVIAIYKELGNVNEFFTTAEEKLRITDQMVMKSSGALNNMLRQEEGLSWFTSLPARNSGYATLRMVLQDLMAILFHDFVSVPFPSAVEHEDMAGTALPSVSKVKKTIGNFLFKPNLYMMPPPACNIFFPDEYSSFQFQRNFFKEPTRLIYMPELPSRGGQGSDKVSLPHVYEPETFNEFMKSSIGSTLPKTYQGDMSFDIPRNKDLKKLGVMGNDSSDSIYKEHNGGRQADYNFLTNEEYMKGVWLYRETMMPATSMFRTALDADYSNKTDFTQKVAKYLFYKRRFQDRQLQITSHLKMSVVPGFPVLVLDDSDADQNIIAYCTSVSQRVYATEGGYTNVQLAYARYAAEQDTSSQAGTQFLTPPWFDELVFGPIPPLLSKSNKKEVGKLKVQGYPAALSDFYKVLLGEKGSKALTNFYDTENSIVGSIRVLLKKYREKKDAGSGDVMDFIAQITSREYIPMKDYYKFYGATTKAQNVEEEQWITFDGDVFTRTGKVDATVMAQKNAVVNSYREALKTMRGFRG